MTRKPILIDCDPGQDDAVMLLLAFGARDALDIRGITTVAGNVSWTRPSATPGSSANWEESRTFRCSPVASDP